MLRSQEIIECFGRLATSPELDLIFQALNTLRRPDLEDDDDVKYFDWVLVKRKGVELGFADSAYLNAESPTRWGHGELILAQVYFYTAFDGISAFDGELPFDLKFSDGRSDARGKMQEYEALRRSWKNDTWVLGKYNVTVVYSEASGLIERVACRVLAAPILQSDLTAWPGITGIMDAIGGAVIDFAQIFDHELLEAQLDDYEIDLSHHFGVTIHLAGDSGDAQLVQSISFHANRDVESIGWGGELPFGLKFSDSPEILRKKVVELPLQESDSMLTGYCVWNFSEFTMHVLYSNFDNALLRITVRAPRTWKCIDDS